MKARMHLLIILVIIASLFAGCSVDPIQEASETDNQEIPSETSIYEPPKPYDGQVLHVLSHDNVYGRSLKILADDFKAKTGATLQLEPVDQSTMEARIQSDFLSGAGDVDVAYMPHIFTSQWASAGWVQPVDDYVARDETELDMNDFVASAMDTLRYEGHLYGLPGFAGTALMAYRSDILEAHGYTEAPKTWEELLEVCEAIDSPETAAIAMRSQAGQGLNMFIFPMFMWAYDGGFFQDFPSDMTPVINTPENLRALTVYSELIIDYSPEGGKDFSYPEVIDSMQTGKVAIIIDGTSVLGSACDPEINPYSETIKMALIPQGPNGSSPSFSVHGWAIPTFSNNQELAWEFIKWATSSDIQKKIALGEGGEVYMDYTRESVGNDSNVLSIHSTYNMGSLRNESLKTTRWDFRPLMNEWPEIGDLFAAYVHEVITYDMTAEEALLRTQKGIIEILEEADKLE